MKITVQSHSHTCYSTKLTGIGESKHGLPLGRLNVRIVSLKFTASEMMIFGASPLVKMRVTIKGKN